MPVIPGRPDPAWLVPKERQSYNFLWHFYEDLLQKLKVFRRRRISVQPALARRPMLNSTYSVQSEVSRILLAHMKPGLGQGCQDLAPQFPTPLADPNPEIRQ